MTLPPRGGPAALAAGLLALSGASPVASQDRSPIRVHEERRTYPVTGGTAEEVWESLLEAARREEGDPVFAWTDVGLEYRSRLVGKRGGCRVAGVEVDVRIGVTLPEWTTPRDAPLALRNQWNRYAMAIRRHEDGHVRRARETARRLRDALVHLTAGDCETLKEWGASVGERILADGRAEQERYDRETGHGRTQGVRWDLERSRPEE